MSDKSNTTETPKPVTVHHSNNLRMILLSMVILVAGIVIGSSGTMIMVKRNSPDHGPSITGSKMLTLRLVHMLDLEEKQSEKIEPVIKKHFDKLDELRRKNQPLITSTIKEMNNEISSHLTDEQKEKWKEEIEKFQKQKGFRRYRGHGQGRGPGPGSRGPGDGSRGPGRGPGRGMGPDREEGDGRGFGPGSERRWPRRDEHRPPADPNSPNSLPPI